MSGGCYSAGLSRGTRVRTWELERWLRDPLLVEGREPSPADSGRSIRSRSPSGRGRLADEYTDSPQSDLQKESQVGCTDPDGIHDPGAGKGAAVAELVDRGGGNSEPSGDRFHRQQLVI